MDETTARVIELYKTLDYAIKAEMGPKIRSGVYLYSRVIAPDRSAQLDTIRQCRNATFGHGVGEMPSFPAQWITFLQGEIEYFENNKAELHVLMLKKSEELAKRDSDNKNTNNKDGDNINNNSNSGKLDEFVKIIENQVKATTVSTAPPSVPAVTPIAMPPEQAPTAPQENPVVAPAASPAFAAAPSPVIVTAPRVPSPAIVVAAPAAPVQRPVPPPPPPPPVIPEPAGPEGMCKTTDGSVTVTAEIEGGKGIYEKGIFNKEHRLSFNLSLKIEKPSNYRISDVTATVMCGLNYEIKNIKNAEVSSTEIDLPASIFYGKISVTVEIEFRIGLTGRKVTRAVLIKTFG